MLAKKTSKNQLTLPKEIANKFPNVDLFDATVENNRIVLVPVRVTPITASLEGIRDKMLTLGIDEQEVVAQHRRDMALRRGRRNGSAAVAVRAKARQAAIITIGRIR